jgi:sirohydrochlorin cobaltochelatase
MNEEYKVDTKEAYDAEERRRKACMAKPMSSAPMRYTEDGAVDWGNMWDSFCVLASAGGPAHRATMLTPEQGADPNSDAYQNVQSEIIRGIFLVSGLQATPASAGWIAVECPMEGMAAWVAEQGVLENVMIQQHDSAFWVPCGQNWTVKGEVKNVITVVAKVTHYFADHISSDMKTTLIVEEGLSKVGALMRGLFGGRKHAIQ